MNNKGEALTQINWIRENKYCIRSSLQKWYEHISQQLSNSGN